MKLAGDYLFEAPVDEVWSALMDPEVLAAVMPGCEKLDKVDGAFVGEMNIKVGPVQGKFAGKVELKDVDEPKGYTMIIDGRGVPGFVKATARILLVAEGTGTRITYDADAQVGGKIASVGQRLIEATSKAIAKQSLDGLHENVKLRYAAGKEAAAAEAPAAATAEEPAAKAEPAPTPAADPAPAAIDEPAAKTEETKEAEPAPAAAPATGVEPAAKAETTEAKPVTKSESPPTRKMPPAVILKKVDQKALAAAVSKEVAKSILPPPVMIGLGVAIAAVVVYLLVR